ncbi:prepilin peptidase [Dyella caseinilytica]|uniref:Prepilin peptidase n=2 Tax=Dyella caseinilytica TaxID=1849581 RepID=A0ABX7H0X3_9GAMM|nr:prepilin peptidase [Dyella caseinilytica]QRN55846.1 prepilin peptidase [Dyella caseinilytica]
MPTLLFALAVPFCALIAISDISARRVPNSLLAIVLILGALLLCAQWAQGQTGAPSPSMIGLLVGLISLLPFYVIHWMGAGDVKLFATLGFLLGAKALLPIWVIASLLAGAHAIYLLASNYRLRHATQGWLDASTTHALTSERIRRGTPYAAFLSAGALITLFNPSLTYW